MASAIHRTHGGGGHQVDGGRKATPWLRLRGKYGCAGSDHGGGAGAMLSAEEQVYCSGEFAGR